MPSCAAYGCNSAFRKKIPGITFHMFPKDETLRLEWVKAVGRKDWVPKPRTCLCSKHFQENDFERASPLRVYLKSGTVPSVFGEPSYLQKIVNIPVSEPTHQESKKSTSQHLIDQQESSNQTGAIPVSEPTHQESKKSTSQHLIDQQESSNQALYTKQLKKGDLPVYPVSISKASDASSENLVNVLKLEIECLHREKESSNSVIENFKHKIECLQREKESSNREIENFKHKIKCLHREKESSNREIENFKHKIECLQREKESSNREIENFKHKIKCLQCEKALSHSEMENFKQKIKHLQQETKSVSINNKMLRNKIEQLEHSNKLKGKQLKVLQQYKRRIKQRVKTVKGIITSLDKNEGIDDNLQKGTFEFGDRKFQRFHLPKNKSDTKIENMDLCHPEELIVVGHVVSPEAEPSI